MSKRYSIANAALILGIGILLSRGVGFLSNILLASHYGVSSQMDAFQIAYSIPLAGISIFLVVLEPLIPMMVEARTVQGDHASWKLVSAIGIFFFWAGAIASILVFFAMPLLIATMAPGFDAPTRAIAEILGRLMTATLGLGLIAAYTKYVAQAYGHFTVPALASVAPAFFIVLTLLLFPQSNIVWIGAAVLLGTIVQLGFQIIELKRLGGYLSVSMVPRAQLHIVSGLTIPALLIAITNQIMLFSERSIGSLLGVGVVSALAYSYRITEVPSTLLSFSIPTAMFPSMSEDISRGNVESFWKKLNSGILTSLLFILPIAVSLAVLAVPVVRVLFMRGAFGEESVNLTASFLRFYALALIPGPIIVMLSRGFYALRKLKQFAFLAIISYTLTIGCYWLFSSLFGSIGLPLGDLVGTAIQAVLLSFGLSRTVHILNVKQFGITLAKLALAGCGMGLACVLIWQLAGNFTAMGTVETLGFLGFTVIVAGIIYFVLLKVLHVREVDQLVHFFVGRLFRRPQPII